MKKVKTKMLGLLMVVLLVWVSGCYKKVTCIDRRVCVIYYKGTDTNILCRTFVKDTAELGKVAWVTAAGYDYKIIYDSTLIYDLKLRKENLSRSDIYNSICTSL